MAAGRYLDLLKSGGFQSFLWTQFLGAFNDNVFKYVVTMYAISLAAGHGSGNASIAGMVFVLPLLLLSGYAGHLADVASKRSIMVAVKLLEVAIMTLGFFAIGSGSVPAMIGVLGMMGIHSTFFSPAKYGIMPEIVAERDLSRGNGLLETTTFMAIILGTALGGFLFASWHSQPTRLSLVLMAISVAGVIFSLGIPRVSPAGSRERFDWNPFGEIALGLKDLRRDPVLWQTALGISYFWFVGAVVQLLLMLLGREVLGLDDYRTGILVTFMALGIGAGNLLAGRLSGDKVELGLVPIGSIGIAVFVTAVGIVHGPYWLVLLLLVGLGVASGFFAVPLNSQLQERADRRTIGRIMATNNFMNTVGMLSAYGLVNVLGDKLRMPADRVLLIVGLLTFGVTVYLLWILPRFLVRFVFWVFTHTIYRIRIEGPEHVPFRGPALLVCNHISHVDGFLVGACVQRFVRFMVWKPYYEDSRMHWLLSLMQAIPTSGRTVGETRECIRRAREELQDGQVVCIFSEGSVSRTGNLLPFKRGMEMIVEGLDVPVIPVHLDRLWGSIFSFKEGRFFAKWPQRIPFPVTVTFGHPLPSSTRAEDVRETIQVLGADAVEKRRHPADVLPYRVLKTAKRNWFSFAMADSTGRKMTYGQTVTGARLFAGWIAEHCPDERMIGLLLPASVGGAIANLGVSFAGRAPVNLNFTAGREGVASAIERCGIRTVITSRRFLELARIDAPAGSVFLEDILKGFGPAQRLACYLISLLVPAAALRSLTPLSAIGPDDLATVIFSSGSTGTPKGIMLSHFNILSNVESVEQVLWSVHSDRVLGILPFFHSFGFMGTLWFPLLSGFGVVYHPNPADAKTIGELCARYGITITISTPTFYGLYLRKCAPEQWTTVRYAVSGAERLQERLIDAFRERFQVDLFEGYGMTEMSPCVAFNVRDFARGEISQRGRKIGTVGAPLPGVAVSVVDPASGEPVPAGAEGMILVKGPNRMLGYLGQPDETAKAFRDGWYVSGDIGCIDEDGFIRITDRVSRFAKIGGEMVPHGKVEEAAAGILVDHASAVTSIPDESRGERMVLLHTNPDAKPRELWDALQKTGIPKLWIPKVEDIRYVESLPMLGTGKIDLKRLRQLASTPAADPA